MAWWLILAALAAIGVAGWLNRRTLRERLRPANVRAYLKRPVILTRGHTTLYTALVGLAIASTIITSAVNRRELNREREARLEQITAQLVTEDRLMAVERSTRAYARFLAPSDADVLEVYRRYRRACAAKTVAGAQCRRDFAASINRVLRVVNNRIVPAPGDRSPSRNDGGAVTVPRPAPPPSTVTVPGAPGKPGERGPIGPQGPPGKNVDSAIVDGLENRVADLERALANVLGRLPGIDRVLALLCRPPLRICG